MLDGTAEVHGIKNEATETHRRALQDLLDQICNLSDWTFNCDLEPHKQGLCFEEVIDYARKLLLEKGQIINNRAFSKSYQNA
jgi:hypothetical protein